MESRSVQCDAESGEIVLSRFDEDAKDNAVERWTHLLGVLEANELSMSDDQAKREAETKWCGVFCTEMYMVMGRSLYQRMG